METQEINYYGVRLSIEYKIIGNYYPATREQPEEQPDVIITKITAYDSFEDIQSLLEHHEAEIYQKLIEMI